MRSAAVIALALAAGAVAACGGDDGIGVGEPFDTEAGVTYEVTKATVAETEDALYEALGQDPPATSPVLPGSVAPVGGQSYGPPSGVYVAVELAETGSAEGAGEEESDDNSEGGPFVILGGDGEEYTSEAFQLGFDIDSVTEGGEGPSEFTSTGIFDIPADATAGATLEIEEGEATYTVDLGL